LFYILYNPESGSKNLNERGSISVTLAEKFPFFQVVEEGTMQYLSSSTVESAGDYSSKEHRCQHIPDKEPVKSMVRLLFFPN
jgi:hypothetical protein